MQLTDVSKTAIVTLRCHVLESYGNGIKVIDEWSYVEDPDTRPRIYKYLGIKRTQWTVKVTINTDK